jgi:hypothetical protein
MLPMRYQSVYQGETQIVDAEGTVLARLAREDGIGVITAEIEIGRRPPSESCPPGYWLGIRPWSLLLLWHISFRILNLHGKLYYKTMKIRGVY